MLLVVAQVAGAGDIVILELLSMLAEGVVAAERQLSKMH